MIILMTWLIALGDTTHIVVGSVEILYLVFNDFALERFHLASALPL